MKYQVVISATAKQNLREGYEWAAKHAPETAARWLLTLRYLMSYTDAQFAWFSLVFT